MALRSENRSFKTRVIASRLVERLLVDGRISVIIKVLVILTSVLFVFWPDFNAIANDNLIGKSMSYIIAIPFLITYSIYRKRKVLGAIIPFDRERVEGLNTDTLFGLSLYPIAFALYSYGSYSSYLIECHLLSMIILLVGDIIIAFNWQIVRQLIFLLASLILLVPIPIQIGNMIGNQIMNVYVIATYDFVKILGVPAKLYIEGTPLIIAETLHGENLPFTIDPSTSGLYILAGYTLFAIFAAFVTRGATWRRATLYFLGFPLVYGLNILRLATIILIGHEWGGQAAIQIYLLDDYILVFIVILMLLIIGVKRWGLSILTQANVRKCQLCEGNVAGKERFCTYCGSFIRQRFSITRRDGIKVGLILALTLLPYIIQIVIHPLLVEHMNTWITILAYFIKYIMYILALTIIPPSIVIFLHFRMLINEMRRSSELLKRLRSPQELSVLETLCQSRNLPTVREVNDNSLKLNPKDLMITIKEASEIGLVKGIIVNKEDEPLFVWKCTFPKGNPKEILESNRNLKVLGKLFNPINIHR